MRIIVLINSLNTGGAEFSTLMFYQWMKKQGHSIQLVCIKRVSPSLDPVTFELGEGLYYVDAKTWFQRYIKLRKQVKVFKPDVLHSVLFESNMLGRLCKFLIRDFVHLESLVNEMYSIHRLNDPNVNWIKLNGYRMLDRLTQGSVDHFHATSQSVARHYIERVKVKANKITVVERGRSANEFVRDSTLRDRLNVSLEIKEGEKIFIIVARQEFQKGYDTLLKALHKLPDHLNWKCICVGREGNATSQIRKLCDSLNLSSKILWLGHRSDVKELLSVVDLFLFPTRFEGLPGVLIEAEAASLPIICSDIPNNREVVVENRNALLFPVDDPDLMAEQINQLMMDQVRREKMGRESLIIFNEKFNLKISHMRMEKLLMEIS